MGTSLCGGAWGTWVWVCRSARKLESQTKTCLHGPYEDMRKAKLPTCLGAAKADRAVTSVRKHARLRGHPLKAGSGGGLLITERFLFLCGAAGCVERPVAVQVPAGSVRAGMFSCLR